MQLDKVAISDLLSSARLRPMFLNTVRMRKVARRTPHLKSASGLDATKWCKNARSLHRRSDTTSRGMCSVFFFRISWRRRIMIDLLYTAYFYSCWSLPEGEWVALCSCIYDFQLHSTAIVLLGEGASLIIHLVHWDFQGFSHNGLSNKATADPQSVTEGEQNDKYLLNFKYKIIIFLLRRIKIFLNREIYSTLIWYLTIPAKCWMTNVRSVFEEVAKNGLSRCCCFNLPNRVSSVPWGKLKIHKEILIIPHIISGTEKWQKSRSTTKEMTASVVVTRKVEKHWTCHNLDYGDMLLWSLTLSSNWSLLFNEKNERNLTFLFSFV